MYRRSPGLAVRVADAEGAEFFSLDLQIHFSLAVGGEDEHVFLAFYAAFAQNIDEKLLFKPRDRNVLAVEFPVVDDDEWKRRLHLFIALLGQGGEGSVGFVQGVVDAVQREIPRRPQRFDEVGDVQIVAL